MDAFLNENLSQQRTPDEWSKLIRKLRWIGADIEAERIQIMLNSFASNNRVSVVAGPLMFVCQGFCKVSSSTRLDREIR